MTCTGSSGSSTNKFMDPIVKLSPINNAVDSNTTGILTGTPSGFACLTATSSNAKPCENRYFVSLVALGDSPPIKQGSNGAELWVECKPIRSSQMSLGQKIKMLRKENGWSQDEFADIANVDSRQISRYENDKVLRVR